MVKLLRKEIIKAEYKQQRSTAQLLTELYLSNELAVVVYG